MKMAAVAAATDSQGGGGEYNLNSSGNSSGQEWILDAYRSLEPGNYLQEFTSQNVRPDGRSFSTSRPITILQSIFTRNSHGSAMVTLGGSSKDGSSDCGGTTRVIAACTLLVGHPNPSTPNDGDIDITLTASPLSGPRFDIMGRENGDISCGNYGVLSNNNDEQQQLPDNLANIISNNTSDITDKTNTTPSPTDTKEIESWIRRTLRSSRYINASELGIEHGISAWRVRITLHIINHEGNVWDASLLCACAALADLRLPMVEIERGVVRIVNDENTDDSPPATTKKKKVQRRMGRSLTLGPLPVPLTIAILSNKSNNKSDENNTKRKSTILLVDPTHLEEDVASGNTITMVCNTNEEIVEFHKKGSGSRLSMEQLSAVAAMGFGRAREIEKLMHD